MGNASALDGDLQEMSREQLVEEVRRLRAGIREHRDASGHDLCWHHPKLWGLSEPIEARRTTEKPLSETNSAPKELGKKS